MRITICLCVFVAVLTIFSQSTAGNAAQHNRVNSADAPNAQEQPNRAQIEARRQFLFDVMLANPANLDAAFEYAALSARVGELEAAVSTLERMLIFAPGLPRVQLELGVLYFRLKSYETAKHYFTEATSREDVPEPVRQRVGVFLAAIADAQLPSKFSGYISAGVQVQSNANAAPANRGIVLRGAPFVLSEVSVAAEDVNFYVSGSAYYTRKLGTQGDLFEVRFGGYGSKQVERDEIDTLIGEILIGPSFDLARVGMDNARIGIYGIAGAVGLGGDLYTTTLGAGVRSEKTLSPRARVSSRLEYRHREYYNTATATTLNLRTGSEVSASAAVTVRATERTTLNASVFGDRTDAEVGFYSHTEIGAAASVTRAFRPPMGEGARLWRATLQAGALTREYDAPDLLINLTQSQDDTELWARGTLNIPIKNGFGIAISAGVRDRQSNYPTQDFTNYSGSVGVTKAF